jgi:integrase
MAVFKRKGSPHWYIEFELKGRRVRQSSHTTSKRKAEELERKLRGEAHSQVVMGEVAPMTWSDALDRYLHAVIYPKNNPASAKRDLYILNALRDSFGPETQLQAVTAPVISEYASRLLSKKKAPATVNRHLAAVRAVLRRAQREWHTLQVVPEINLLKLNNQRHRWLTAVEEERLLKACPPHLREVVVFLIDTGARKGEALGLTWSDVDLERKPRGSVKFMKTKSGRPRGIPLTHRVSEMLLRLRAIKPEGEEHVFLYRPSDNPTDAKPVRHLFGVWETALKKAGLSDVNIHDLRHTFASRLVTAGVPLFTVSKLLGHADIKMTMRYSHLAPDELESAVDILERWGKKNGGTKGAGEIKPESATGAT